MSTVYEWPRSESRLVRLLTTDYLPWANRFLYWLKEPIGWFVLATASSVLVGLFLNPIGWTLAGSLTAILTVGMAWPLIAVYATECQLQPEVNAVHEDEPCRMILTVRNRIPVPVWGLAVEGYLDCESDEPAPTVSLACVPILCTSVYGLSVRPQLRGIYPSQTPRTTCSFPFGIWTARRKLTATKPLMVWPRIYAIAGTCSWVGRVNADDGDGERGGRSGDFVGIRAYRRGDAARHLNWIASARTDSLIVTERGGPQHVELDVWVDVSSAQSREQFADRIRVAASILLNLHQSSTPMRIRIGSQSLRIASGAKGRVEILSALARVPADGRLDKACLSISRNAAVEITGDARGDCIVNLTDPCGRGRAANRTRSVCYSDSRRVGAQVLDFWTEARHGKFTA